MYEINDYRHIPEESRYLGMLLENILKELKIISLGIAHLAQIEEVEEETKIEDNPKCKNCGKEHINKGQELACAKKHKNKKKGVK